MPTIPDLKEATGRLGRASGRGDAAGAAEARRDIEAAKLKNAIQRTLSTVPPLTAAQREALAAMLIEGDVL